MSTYEDKKASCKQRHIGFKFTEGQWNTLMSLRNTLTCAYTGQPFSDDRQKPTSPTVERIDSTLPYFPANCILVQYQANQDKEKYIENTVTHIPASKKEDVTLISQKLASGEIQRIVKKDYLPKYKGKLWTPSVSTKITRNINLSKKYTELAKSFTRSSGDFLLTFSEFKVMCARKYCPLSGLVLPLDLGAITLRKVDEDKPMTKENTLVVSKQVNTFLNIVLEEGLKYSLTLPRLKKMIGSL